MRFRRGCGNEGVCGEGVRGGDGGELPKGRFSVMPLSPPPPKMKATIGYIPRVLIYKWELTDESSCMGRTRGTRDAEACLREEGWKERQLQEKNKTRILLDTALTTRVTKSSAH